MLEIADSHCHLNLLDLGLFENDINKVIKIANEKNVKYLLTVSVELKDAAFLKKYSERFENVWYSVGVHPTHSTESIPSAQKLLSLASEKKVVAIGETGLDYYRDVTTKGKELQQQSFATHIKIANDLNKPLIIHTRAAKADTIAMLKQHQANSGVMHCFTEDWEMAKQALDIGFYISFSGIVTFKNAKQVQEVAKKTPMDRMLIETDAPYLAPVPYRGKPNQPAYVRYVAEYMAEHRNMTLEEVAETTTQNFKTLFSI